MFQFALVMFRDRQVLCTWCAWWVGKGAAWVISWANPATSGLVQQMFQSYSHTQVWRKKRTTTMRMNTMMAPALKNRQIRTGFSQAHAHQTPMPRTTAASCSLYWWPLVSLFLPSSASAGCESKPHRATAEGLGGKELDQTRLLSISPYCS